MASDYNMLEACVKRDPVAYRDDFMKEYRHYESQLEVFMLHPPKSDAENKEFGRLVQLVGFCSTEYDDLMPKFAPQMGALLDKHLNTLNHGLRQTIVKTLITVRNKDKIPALEILQMFFKLFRCHDKSLRTLLYNHIISDITFINNKKHDHVLNRELVNFMYTMLEDQDPTAAKKSLEVMVELHKRRVWNDAKTVNAIASAIFSPFTKLRIIALHFFLNIDDDSEQREAARKSKEDVEKQQHKLDVTRKTRSKKRKMKQVKAEVVKAQSGEGNYAPTKPNWPAIELIYDPHGFCRKLFGFLKKTNDGWDVRLLMLNLVSRLIACHKVVLVSFYPYMMRYIRPRQDHVTHVLAITAQACHEMVPPDVIQPILRTIADQFINETVPDEIMATGMNALSAICRRCPLAMDQDLLRDLVQYKRSKNRAVMASAREMIELFRQTNPALLQRKDRGRGVEMKDVLQYGQQLVHDDVQGIELLRLVKDILAGRIRTENKDSKDTVPDKKAKKFNLKALEQEEAVADDESEDEDENKEEEEEDGSDDDDDDDDESDDGFEGWEVVDEEEIGEGDEGNDSGDDDDDDISDSELVGDDDQRPKSRKERRMEKKKKAKREEKLRQKQLLKDDEDDKDDEENDDDDEIEVEEDDEEDDEEMNDDEDDDNEDDDEEEDEGDEEGEEEGEEEEEDDEEESKGGVKRSRQEDDAEDEDEEADGKLAAKKQRQEDSEGNVVAKTTSAESSPQPQQSYILSQTDVMLLQKLNKLAAEDPRFERTLRRMTKQDVSEMLGTKKKIKKSAAEESSSDEEEEEGDGTFLTPEDIAARIKSRMTKEERRLAMKEAQEDKSQYKMTRGRSKKVQARNKNYLMKMLGQRSKRRARRDALNAKKRSGRRDKNFRGHFKKKFGSKTGKHK